MDKNITHNDLILYAYNELSPERTLELDLALSLDPRLEEEYLAIIEVQNKLDSGLFSPHPTTLQIILEESSSAMEVA